jgi:hypothetical protein
MIIENEDFTQERISNWTFFVVATGVMTKICSVEDAKKNIVV